MQMTMNPTMDPTMDMKTMDPSMGPMDMSTKDPMGDMHMPMNDSMDMMKMYFHFGYESVVLFEKWAADTDGALFGTCVFFFVLAIVYELFKYYRQFHLTRAQSSLLLTVSEETGTSSNSPDTNIIHKVERTGRPVIRMLSIPHLIQTTLHMIQMFVSYVLMLAFMTFNVWICLSVILGAGVGYFMVGSRRAQSYSGFEDHCH